MRGSGCDNELMDIQGEHPAATTTAQQNSTPAQQITEVVPNAAAKETKSLKRRRIASPLLRREFADRSRMFDVAVNTIAACWGAAFAGLVILNDNSYLEKIAVPGILASLVGIPSYLLVRLGSIILTLSAPALREELAVTPIRGEEFLRERLLPHIIRCAGAPLFILASSAGLLFIRGDRDFLEEIVLAYYAVIASVFFGVMAFLLGFLSIRLPRVTPLFFNVARALIFLGSICSPVLLVFVLEEDYKGLHLLPPAMILLSAAWFLIRQRNSIGNRSAAPELTVRFLPIFSLLMVGFWLLDLVIAIRAGGWLASTFSPFGQLPAVEIYPGATLFVLLLCLVFVSQRRRTERLVPLFNFHDALLVYFWVAVAKIACVSRATPDLKKPYIHDLWLTIYPMLHMFLYVAVLAAIAGTIAGELFRGEGVAQKVRIIIIGCAVYLCAIAAAWFIHRHRVTVLLPMLALHYLLLLRNRLTRPLLFRYAAYVPAILVIATVPTWYGLPYDRYEDTSVVFPFIAAWAALAAFAWKSAGKNYLTTERW